MSKGGAQTGIPKTPTGNSMAVAGGTKLPKLGTGDSKMPKTPKLPKVGTGADTALPKMPKLPKVKGIK